MSGHNRWSKVKNVKGPADAKKGKIFTKITKELIVSAKIGGGNPEGNPRLRQAILQAKAASMPKDNIERAIKKGTGQLQGELIEEVIYEGYGPGGVAMLVETTTDNRNRTVSDLRNLFKSNGGHLGESGSVLWMFEQCGQLLFDGDTYKEEQIMEVAIEAGAKDVTGNNGMIEVTTSMNDVYRLKDAFEKVGMHPASAGIGYSPKSSVKIENKDNASHLIRFFEALEDHDDVQKIHSNFDMDDKLFGEVTGVK